MGSIRTLCEYVHGHSRCNNAALVVSHIARDSIQFEKYEQTEQRYSNFFAALFDIRRIDAAPDKQRCER